MSGVVPSRPPSYFSMTARRVVRSTFTAASLTVGARERTATPAHPLAVSRVHRVDTCACDSREHRERAADELTDRLHASTAASSRAARLGFLVAVIKKFGDDQAGQLAALISYYAFVSLFPLLLVFVTILGFVLQGDPGEQHKILDGTLGQLPIIRDQLKLHSLTGSAAALVIGIVLALLAGMGITNATQNALNRIWSVPFKRRPDFLHARLRSLGMLAILGTLAIVSAVVGGFVGSCSHPALTVVARRAGGVRRSTSRCS